MHTGNARIEKISIPAMWCDATTVDVFSVDVSSQLLTHWMCPQDHNWCILKTAHSLCILTTAHSLCILTTINRRRISTTIYKRHVLSTVHRRWVLHNQYVILYRIVRIFFLPMRLYTLLRSKYQIYSLRHTSYFLLLFFIHTYFFQII